MFGSGPLWVDVVALAAPFGVVVVRRDGAVGVICDCVDGCAGVLACAAAKAPAGSVSATATDAVAATSRSLFTASQM